MYDIQSQKIIDYWTMLEDDYENVSMILFNKVEQINIQISNNNEMKYLYVFIINKTNYQKVFQQYTHIHSFVSDMIELYGVNVFQNYVIKYNETVDIKRHIDNVDNKEENKIKRTKYE